MSEPTFTELARKVAEEHPDVADYHALSEHMLDEIRGRERMLLERLLPGYMRAVLSRRGEASSEEAAWEAFLDERIATPGRGTIFVRDALPAELDEAAARREKFAGNLDKRAVQFRSAAARVRKAKVAKVGELATEAGAALFHDLEVKLAVERLKKNQTRSRLRSLDQLRAVRDQLRRWLSSEDPPSLVSLRQFRDSRAEVLAELRLKHEFAKTVRQVQMEMFGGQG